MAGETSTVPGSADPIVKESAAEVADKHERGGTVIEGEKKSEVESSRKRTQELNEAQESASPAKKQKGVAPIKAE
jgi:hypothetical protein